MHNWWHVCVCRCMSVLCLWSGCTFCVAFPAWVFSYIFTCLACFLKFLSFLHCYFFCQCCRHLSTSIIKRMSPQIGQRFILWELQFLCMYNTHIIEYCIDTLKSTCKRENQNGSTLKLYFCYHHYSWAFFAQIQSDGLEGHVYDFCLSCSEP